MRQNSRWEGYCTTWNDSDSRPNRRPSPTPPADVCDAEKWQTGYNDGLLQCRAYRAGMAAGLANEPSQFLNSNTQEGYNSGYRRGNAHYLRNRLLPLAKKGKYVLVIFYFPDVDYDGDRTPAQERHQNLTPWAIVAAAVEDLRKWGSQLPTDWEGVIRLASQNHEGDGSYCNARIVTAKQAKREKNEAEFLAMERIANRFAAESGCKFGTMGFLKALDKAVRGVRGRQEAWNNPERRAEEYAAHMFCGSRDAYFDDLNFENGRFHAALDELSLCYAYIERKFPLLMMRYKEAKKARRKAKRSR